MSPTLLVRTCIAIALLAVSQGCGRDTTVAAPDAPAPSPAPTSAESTAKRTAVDETGTNQIELGIIGQDDGRPAGALLPLAETGDPRATWDAELYARDPAAWCAVVVGDRAWQIAQPGPAVPFLEAVGATSLTVRPGDVVRLAARTKPHMPVSWTSSGLGEFRRSGLVSVTAQADANGVAWADFRLTHGTVGTVLITAGSPVCGATLQYLLRVESVSAAQGMQP